MVHPEYALPGDVSQSGGLEPLAIGYRCGMNVVVIVVIVAVVVALVAVLMKRRANQKAEELRLQAQEHRDEAKASQIAATRTGDPGERHGCEGQG